MTLWRVQHALQDIDGLARDQYVNTWHMIDSAPTDPIVFAAAATAFTTFYTALQPYMAGAVSPTIGSLKIYNVAHRGSHLPPDYQVATGYVPPGGVKALPFEVAMCITLKGDPQPAPVKRQSTTGRVYLGPLNVNALQASGGTLNSRPDPAFIIAMADALLALDADLIAHAHCALGILSVKQRKFYGATKAFVDNSWDTQRSRGDRPTARQSRVLATGIGVIEPF